MEITQMQRKMESAFGHNVEVHLVKCDKPVIGKCINFTKPLDNDPEVASIDIALPSQFAPNGFRIVEITEEEIETIMIEK